MIYKLYMVFLLFLNTFRLKFGHVDYMQNNIYLGWLTTLIDHMGIRKGYASSKSFGGCWLRVPKVAEKYW